MPYQITRRFEFDAAHRVMRHESKCRHLHGHRYVAEVSVIADVLDELDRAVDFGVVKSQVGAWIDVNWDHGLLLNAEDEDLVRFAESKGWRVWVFVGNPTAEVIAETLRDHAQRLLTAFCHAEGSRYRLRVSRVRLYETPNCWADAEGL